MSVINNPHDRFFKEVFSRPDVAAGFLHQYLPEAVSAEIDVSTLQLRKDSFIDPDLQQQFADLLYSVRLSDNHPAWVYVLFEHKSYPDPLTAFQMLRYMVRIWEQELRGGGSALAPIIPIVIYHGAHPWHEATNLGDLYHGPRALRAYWPTFAYHLCDLSQENEATVRGVLFLQGALLVMRAVSRTDFADRLPAIMRLLAQLTNEVGAVEYVIAVLRYVSATRAEATPDLLRKAMDAASIDAKEELMSNWVEDLIEQGMQKGVQLGKTEGEIEGITKGRTEEAVRLVENLLQHRFGTLDANLRSRLAQLPVERLETLSTVILDAHSMTDVHDYLNRVLP